MKPQELRTRLFTPPGPLGSALRSILTDRACIAQEHNFLRGLQMHSDYLENTHFRRWKGNSRPLGLGENKQTEQNKHPDLILNPFSEFGGQVWAEPLLD